MEHDYRFPRRPDGRQLGDHDRRTLDVSMLDKTIAAAGHRLLSAPLFPPFDDADAAQQKSIPQMQQEDPLAMQVWKFFSSTKQQLPNQDRMENLTWRMMAVELRKHQAAKSRQTRYDTSSRLDCRPHVVSYILAVSSRSFLASKIVERAIAGVRAHGAAFAARPSHVCSALADSPPLLRRATDLCDHRCRTLRAALLSCENHPSMLSATQSR